MIHPHLSGYSISANNTFTITEPANMPNPTPTIHGVNDAIRNKAVNTNTNIVIIKPLK